MLVGEAGRLREIRLRSLAADPSAFASTHAHEDGLPQQWWDEWAALSEDGGEQRTFVLVDDGDAWLGIALARSDRPDSESAVVNAMWVTPEARGRGGARMLLLCETCAGWATEHGFRELCLDVVVGNERALRVYEAAGFVIRGETTWHGHGRTLHEHVMARAL